MSNLSTTVIILLIAIVLLWLALTDKLSRLLDAWDVIIGKASATSTTVASALPGSTTVLQLPTLPALAHANNVPAV